MYANSKFKTKNVLFQRTCLGNYRFKIFFYLLPFSYQMEANLKLINWYNFIDFDTYIIYHKSKFYKFYLITINLV